MIASLLGLFETFGFHDTFFQIYEKIVLNPRRYGNVMAEEKLFQVKSPFCFGPSEGSPKKVILLCHAFFPDSIGGTERFARSLAKELQAAGDQVTLFAYSARLRRQYSERDGDILFSREIVDGIPVIRLRHTHPKRGLLKGFPSDPAMEAFAKKVLQAVKPDAVHLVHLGRLYGFIHACLQQKVPYFVTLTDFFAICHYSTRIDKKGQLCPGSQQGKRCAAKCASAQVRNPCDRYHEAMTLLTSAELVVAPSSYVAGIYEQEFPGLRVEVIPHGIAQEFRWKPKRGEPRRFGYIGKLADLKGVLLLLRAFQSMPADCTLDLYGTGNAVYVHKLHRFAARDARIHFHGPVALGKMAVVYRELDCVVIPSLVPETYNFVLRESLQSGCFVVAAAIGAMLEVLDATPNGFAFSCGDEQALSAALHQVRRCKLEELCMERFDTPAQEASTYRKCYQIRRGE